MTHDVERAKELRRRIATQLALIASLESMIAVGELEQLKIARNQTEDVETLYLSDLDRRSRTPAEEARWLSFAGIMLATWGPYLEQTEKQFKSLGGKDIEVV